MKALTTKGCAEASLSEFLILPDGRIMVHNLTVEMARVLQRLIQDDKTIDQRIPRHRKASSGKST